MRVAALDLGSNTFLCLIAEVDSTGKISILSDLAEVVRLGEGVAVTGVISEEALQRASRCLERFKAEITKFNPEKIRAVSTAAARNAKNKNDLFQIFERANIPLEIIHGNSEAELTFKGAISGNLSAKKKLIIDIGGGSTELIVGSPSGILYKKSFEVGVVKLREKFIHQFPIGPDIQELIEKEISDSIKEAVVIDDSDDIEIIAVAGTPTTLAAVVLGGFDVQKIEGFRFTLDQLLHWQKKMCLLSPIEIEQQFKVPPGRSDVIAVGIMILVNVLQLIQRDSIAVSTRGLRYGVATHLALEELPNA